jgi:hypothetical protein
MSVGNKGELVCGSLELVEPDLDLGAEESVNRTGRAQPRQLVARSVGLCVTASSEQGIGAKKNPRGIGLEPPPDTEAREKEAGQESDTGQ